MHQLIKTGARGGIWLAIVLCLTPVTRAQAPAAPARKVYTEADFYRESVPYFRGLLGEVYKKAGTKDARWDAPAAAFLEQMAEYFATRSVREYYWPPTTPTMESLLKAGAELTTLGCTDPLVCFCIGELLHAGGQIEQAKAMFAKALIAEGKPGFPDEWYIRALPRTARAGTRLPNGAQLPGDPAIGQPFAKRQAGICAGPLSGVARRQALRHFRAHIHTPEWRGEVIKAIDALPNGDAWVRDVLAGRMHVDLAWQARGSGAANTVDGEAWHGFFTNLKLSRDALARAYKLAPELPESSDQMITVAMGGSDQLNENIETWFTRALEAQVDMPGSYESFRKALLPRWGGSYDKMLAVGLACIKQPRYETLVPWELIATLEDISTDLGEPWAVLAEPRLYALAAEVLEGYAKSSGPGRGNYFQSGRIAIAMRAGKLDEARKHLDAWKAAGGQLDFSAFEYFRVPGSPADISAIYAHTGAAKADCQAMVTHLEEGRAKEALAAAKAARSKLAAEDPGLLHIDATIARLNASADYEAGEWVQLPAAMDPWTVVEGNWRADGKGGLLGSNAGSARSKLLLFTDPMVKLDPAAGFELSVVIDAPAAKGPMRGPGPYGGIVIYRLERPNLQGWVQLMVGKGFGEVAFSGAPMSRFDTKANEQSELTVRCKDYTLTVYVDQKKVSGPHPLPDGFRSGVLVGIGGRQSAEVRFSKLRARNLIKVKDANE